MSDQNVHQLTLGELASSDHRAGRIQDEVSRIYESRSMVVFRTTLGITRNAEEAEDITQEAFLRLYLALRNGEPIRNTVEWLVVVAKNLARDGLKRQRRLTSIADPVMTMDNNPEETLVAASYYQMWLRVRSRLPPTERACLELYGKGATFKEISATLGLPYRDAITRTRQAMDRCRRLAAEGRG